jgi:hypothetical protein
VDSGGRFSEHERRGLSAQLSSCDHVGFDEKPDVVDATGPRHGRTRLHVFH